MKNLTDLSNKRREERFNRKPFINKMRINFSTTYATSASFISKSIKENRSKTELIRSIFRIHKIINIINIKT